MAINKVVLGTETLIDLTADTVTPSTLMQGYTAHDASGAAITGTATGGDEGSAYQDEDGYIVLGEGESSVPQGTLSITQNGTYDVAQYAGASVEVPVGMTETELKDFIGRTSAFTDIEWPEGIARIGDYAFANCQYFKPSSLPSGVTSVGAYAFYNCRRLALTSLPSGIVSIGAYAFYDCNITVSSIPSGVTDISQYAFASCHYITQMTFPSGLTTISSNAFKSCTGLERITFQGALLTTIDNSAFGSCYALEISVLPSSVTTIYSNAFQYCESITSISCDGAITTLSSAAFNGSASYPMALASASFPNMALTSALGTVFGSTTAANACQLLEFCDIGSTTGIATNAFANCYALETLVLRKTASVCTLANVSAFLNTPMRGYDGKTGTVYVPEALIASYQAATNWSTLYNDGTVTFAKIEGSDYELD